MRFLLLCLLGQFETNVADLHNVTDARGEGIARGLVIQVGTIGASRVLNIPGAVAVPHTGMFAGDERFGQENIAGWTASDGGLWQEVITGPRLYLLAGAAVHDDQVAEYRVRFARAKFFGGGHFSQVAGDGDDHLHKKKVEQND